VTRKFKAILLSLAVAAGIIFVASSPASAAWSDCTTPPEKFCTWLYHDGTGSLYYYTLPSVANHCTNIGGTFDNNVSSVWDRFQYYDVYMYNAHDCTGSVSLIIQPIMGKTNLYSGYDNVFSSFFVK
jgi:Peptidase inhibitor family I36